ncbi:MAG TPA: hypothetical protein VKO87_01980 [Gemmatimonadaceae bacterium]|nr:hypothetical protein [Gemmatimonadaceae bacterium]
MDAVRTNERVRWVWATTAGEAERLVEVAEGHTYRNRDLARANSHGLKLDGDILWRVDEKQTFEAVPDGEATTEKGRAD